MNVDLPIGITKGPGETPHEFTFVAPDPEQRLKYGEFVYYEVPFEGEPRRILARISQRVPLRLFPDSFMSDPAVPPAEVAGLLGYQSDVHELFELTAVTLGYYEIGSGFVNPRIPPYSGAPIYIAADETLAEVLSRRRPGELGAAHIGSLLSRERDAVPIALEVRRFTSTHLAIIASTGSGKSYLAAGIVEELMKPNNRASVLIIDPHGEYDTLVEMQGMPEFSAPGYTPRVRIVRPGDIHVRVSSLTLGDLRYLLPNLSERMHHLLSLAFGRVNRQFRGKWTRAQLEVAIRQGMRDEPVTDPEDEAEEDSSVGPLIWRIHSILGGERSIFDDHINLPLGELFQPGQCTVLQLNDVPEREQQIVVATLLRRLDQGRRDTVRGLSKPEDEDHVPYPAFVLIEEAHNFAPAGTEIITTQILKQILSEGRKFGLAVGLISQRPGRLDSDVLSQCMTQCVMRIVNPIDQARVAESVESVGRDLLMELPSLTRGQVIVAGAAVNTPVMVQVRRRITPHGAEDPDAPVEWMRYFDEEARRRRERDAAPPPDSPTRQGRDRMFR